MDGRRRTILTASLLNVLSWVYFFLDFLREDLFRGTLPPSLRACDSPIAIACLRLLTFLPDRPLFNAPLFRSRIARLTFWDAFLPYLAMLAPPRIAAAIRWA